MKRICLFLFSVIFLTTSCTTLIAPYKGVIVYDYSSLTGKGIFVTESNSVSFNYEAAGSISITMLGGQKAATTSFYSSGGESSKYKGVSFEDMTQELLVQLDKLNANGIINLKITYEPANEKQGSGYTVSGMAIRK